MRAISDFEFEFQMALVNKKLNCNIETMFMVTNNMYSYISSSIVKEVLVMGDIRGLVPPKVYSMIKIKYSRGAIIKQQNKKRSNSFIESSFPFIIYCC